MAADDDHDDAVVHDDVATGTVHVSIIRSCFFVEAQRRLRATLSDALASCPLQTAQLVLWEPPTGCQSLPFLAGRLRAAA